MHQLKLSDSLMIPADAMVEMAQKTGIKTSIIELYSAESIKDLALIASLMRQHIQKYAYSKPTIEVINDAQSKAG